MKNWAIYVTGGVITALVYVAYGLAQQQMPREVLALLIILFFGMACFKTWGDQFRCAKCLEASLADEKAANALKVTGMQAEISEFKRKLDDRQQAENKAQETKLVREILGEYRIQLRKRLVAINAMSPDEYERTRNGDNDAESNDLVNDIAQYIQRHIGQNSYVDFVDLTGMDRTRIVHYNARTVFEEDWQRVQHQLRHHEKNLGKIANRLPG